MSPVEDRARETVNDSARAISRLIWELPEHGCVPGSKRERDGTAAEKETRKILRDLRERLASYFGEGALD